ncbi:MAG TPA: DMT family transporter [Bdellovibrio sp.]|nr:DMT family transporter [Bdellovibrio sp.]
MKSGLIAINIAAIIFGTAVLYGKLNVSPFWIVAARSVFACVALYCIGFFKKDLNLAKGFSKRRPLIITGLLLGTHWLTFFGSVQLAGVAIATLAFATFPLFTVFAESIKLRKLPSILQVVAAVSIVVAVSLLINLDASGAQIQGAIAGLVSAATFAVFGIKSKQLTKELTPITVSFMQNLTVAISTSCFLPLSHPLPTSSTDWMCLVLLGVVTTAIMHQLYLFALTKLSATVCSGFIALEPIYAIVLAAIFFKEPITFWVVVSGFLIIGASLVLLRSESENINMD